MTVDPTLGPSPRTRGVSVRPGSVRQARQEAGLSLAAVAASRMSRNFVHLIEAGRARPSMENLRWIAQRTGKPVEFFLDPAEAEELMRVRSNVGHSLLEVRTHVAKREWTQAVEKGTALLGRSMTQEEEAWVRFEIGQAMVRALQLDGGLEQLERARLLADSVGDSVLAIECRDWYAVALFTKEDPRAIGLLERAIDEMSQLDQCPPAVIARATNHLASMYAHRRAWRRAAHLYEASLSAAHGVLDLYELGQIHDGLAHAYMELDRPVKALEYAHRAIQLFELEADRTAYFRAENNLGDILLREGDLDGAEQHLMQALAGFEASKPRVHGLTYALTNLAELSLRRRDHAAATTYALRAVHVADEAGERTPAAVAMVILARIAERDGRSDDADQHCREALRIAETTAAPERIRDIHMVYAEILTARGDTEAALKHWRIAAEIGRDLSATTPFSDEELFYAGAG